ncbi:MAG TPA: Fe-S cluster assembly protein SufD [Rhodospirillales bacterium]|jgi:Fe-S cluster assembly protein SufD|nr:Fe-S cluster assembly protein SufD [Rhodospirillales bacterium]HJO68895.1 Fe-S cluster assembly protein SufD [Rhodospirillales bacterium]
MRARTTQSWPTDERLIAAERAAAAGPAWLAETRRQGLRIFRDAGVPHAKIEAWKYTGVNGLVGIGFDPHAPAPEVRIPPPPLAGLEDAYRVVFVNGRFAPLLSELDGLAEGVAVVPLTTAAADPPEAVRAHLGRVLDLDGMPFAALNAAFWTEGCLVTLDDGCTLSRPIHLVSIAAGGDAPTMFAPRTLVVFGRGARATIVESHLGTDGAPTFSNAVSEVVAAEGAVVEHYKQVQGCEADFHVGASAVSLGAGASYDGFALTLGGRLVRNETRVTLASPGAECRINGAYAAFGDSHVDNTTLIDHVAAGATSRETFMGVVGDSARGVFQGKTLVRAHAQKTDGHMLHKALLLSSGAEVDAKPELEIYADDVKCSHGATAGKLDETMLFYLLSRGIPRGQARRLLIEAFLAGALDEIRHANVREALRGALMKSIGDATRDLGCD